MISLVLALVVAKPPPPPKNHSPTVTPATQPATTTAPPPKTSPSKTTSPTLVGESQAAVFAVPKNDTGIQQAMRTEEKLAKALKAEVSVSNLEQLFPTPVVENVGARHVKEANEAFENLDLDVAAKKYEDALNWYTSHPSMTDSQQLADMHLFIASVALGQGKNGQKKAIEEMERALVFWPDATLDPKYFGPDAKKFFDKAKKGVADRGTAKLAISSEPASAEAMFRGQPLRDSTMVPLGRHLVTFSKPGFQPTGVIVDVGRDGGTAQVKLESMPGIAQLRSKVAAVVPSSFGALKAPPSAGDLGSSAKARFLVLVSMGAEGGTLEVWDSKSGNVLKDVAVGVDDDSLKGVAATIARFIEHPGIMTATNEPMAANTQVDETVSSKPVYKRWWFWAIVGGVVVAGATTATVVAVQPPANPPYNVVLDMH